MASIAHQSGSPVAPESNPELAPALEQMGNVVVSQRGTILFQQGQAASGVYVVRRGKLRLSRLCEDGHRTSRTVGPGHIIGLLATVSDQPYLKTAEALEDSELTSVDRNRVMSLLDRRADFWLQAVDVIKEEMKLIRKRVLNSNRKKTGEESAA
jgi:CRP-like cAMP-binding protein